MQTVVECRVDVHRSGELEVDHGGVDDLLYGEGADESGRQFVRFSPQWQDPGEQPYLLPHHTYCPKV